ncbi:hypothetical protein ITP53_11550 [Nonomuraea sp. K274]|uniref:Uncharacterized protein n=1 Tax=Nonomuraea cypriaca TaxID=1187855 RepID=A0A931A734_9ACTN|nr:hypothetical protein [Nonomuraea cypriaca]MBF8186373.1 hypothetical protein [Nonomuraea cypriaca]
MIIAEGEELASEVRDLRDVSFGDIHTQESKVMADVLRRMMPQSSDAPAVPIAAFGNYI